MLTYTVTITEEGLELLDLVGTDPLRIAEVLQNGIIGCLMGEALIQGVGTGFDIHKAMKMKANFMVNVFSGKTKEEEEEAIERIRNMCWHEEPCGSGFCDIAVRVYNEFYCKIGERG